MNSIYEIVELAKAKNNIESDNAFAIKFGFRRQNINDWKVGRSEPKGVNLLKLLKAADLSIDEAILLMNETKKPILQAGFINLGLLIGMSGVSLGVLTLEKMSALPYEALALASVAANVVYYVKLDGQIFYGIKVKNKLHWCINNELMHVIAANDIEFDQVSTYSLN